MPLYEYRCDVCGDLFEVIQKFSDEPLTMHAGCGGHVVRLISPSALHFKGTGWYVTDYAHKNGSAPNGKTEIKSESKSESKGESKSESKSEKKSESKNGSAAKTESKAPAK